MTSHFKHLRLPLLAIILMMTACGDDSPSNTAPAAPIVIIADSSPPTPAPAAPLKPTLRVADEKTFTDTIQSFLTAHCIKCHGPDKQKGKLRLDTLQADFINNPHASTWVEVMDRINLGEMPPEEEPKPDAEKLALVTRWIASEVRGASLRAQSTGGRALLRHLTRTEYVNTVRDLLQVEFVAGESPMELLPPDGRLGGFDKVSKGLLLDPSLMDAYYRAAELVADRALITRPPRVPTHTTRFEFEDTATNGALRYIAQQRSTIMSADAMTIMQGGARTFGVLRHPASGTQIPVRGQYTIRVRAAAEAGARGEPIYMDITRGAEGVLAKFKVEAPLNEPKVYELTRTLDSAVQHELQVSFANDMQFSDYEHESGRVQQAATAAHDAGRFNEAARIRARGRAVGLYDVYQRSRPSPQTADLDRVPKLHLDYIEIHGPLHGPWPPASMKLLFPQGLTEERRTLAEARRVFTQLLPRAFRRPVRSEEVEPIITLIASEIEAGESFEDAMKAGLIAMLCSPSFLYVLEPAPATTPAQPSPPRPLNDYEFAARLSYFLWSSMPDAELSQLAARSALRTGTALDVQIDRMLKDPRAAALVNDFAAQWLKVHEFDQFKPDQQIYRAYYTNENAGVGDDMNAQPLELFREILRSDASVLAFIDADWTMLNERLARFYGIEGVTGDAFRRVTLPADSPRGGLVAMAGVHKWGSDGNRTKPVHRGKYILDVLFNDPPDPPPPNAGEIQPNERGSNLSVRQRLQQHAEIESCGNCHRRIDPYGLALENFNAIGQWRTVQDGEQERWGGRAPAIDPAGKLPNGTAYQNVNEFKRALMAQRDRFTRGLAEKLFIYATGRLIEPSDHAAIEAIAKAGAENNYSLRAMLKAIVHSQAFGVK
ncbi:MAG: DUF1592 domain-containing protein [Phycisphaeraceae bacterium]